MAPEEWFCALLESAADVYFRYAIEPARRLAYVSPSIRTLTGHEPADFYADPDLCLAVVAAADRRLVRRLLRARRGAVVALRIVRDGVAMPVELRTVAVIRQRRLVAIEGVARLAIGAHAPAAAPLTAGQGGTEPVQQRLAALMVEVHDLLHRVLPPSPPPRAESPSDDANVLRLGALTLDRDRLVVAESGRAVALTTRELMVLRYLLERPGRVVTRGQLLGDVWDYRYTGDDRTVDVHISRLRRKLPSLRGRLTAIRGIGYRLDAGEDADEAQAVNG